MPRQIAPYRTTSKLNLDTKQEQSEDEGMSVESRRHSNAKQLAETRHQSGPGSVTGERHDGGRRKDDSERHGSRRSCLCRIGAHVKGRLEWTSNLALVDPSEEFLFQPLSRAQFLKQTVVYSCIHHFTPEETHR